MTLSAEVTEAVRLRDAARLDTEWERKIYQAGMVREIVSSHVDLIERLFSEIERLTACLQKANANHEHFEREWYLRGDEIERLQAQLEQAQAELRNADRALAAMEKADALLKEQP